MSTTRPTRSAAIALSLAASAAVVSLSAAAPAAASCAASEFPPGGSAVIFSGTASENADGYTRFDVESVWAGPDLASEVWVLGGQEQPSGLRGLGVQVSSSVDAEFVLGQEYVVGADADFRTTSCRVMEAAGVPVPDDARSPVADGSGGADRPLPTLAQALIATGALGGVVLVVVLLVRRRRSSRRGQPRPA